MALVVAATFLSLTEAQIAAGALAASGLHPVVADETFGSMLWTHQFAIQGFRLLIPQDELADARIFLAGVRSRKIRRPRTRASRYAWAVLAVVLAAIFGGMTGWLAVAGLRRGRRGHGVVAATVTMAFGIIVVALLAIDLAAGLWPFIRGYVVVVLAAVAVIAAARLMRSSFETNVVSTAPAPKADAGDE